MYFTFYKPMRAITVMTIAAVLMMQAQTADAFLGKKNEKAIDRAKKHYDDHEYRADKGPDQLFPEEVQGITIVYAGSDGTGTEDHYQADCQ